MLQRLRRWLSDNVSTDTPERASVSMRFYANGRSEIESVRGYLMTSAQHEAMREFMLTQMEQVLEAFENERRRVRFYDERVIAFPISKEIN